MTMMFDTRNAVQRLIRGGLSETQSDAVVDVTRDATREMVTRDVLQAALEHTKDQLRIEIWRVVAFQTIVFAGIVAALTKL